VQVGEMFINGNTSSPCYASRFRTFSPFVDPTLFPNYALEFRGNDYLTFGNQQTWGVSGQAATWEFWFADENSIFGENSTTLFRNLEGQKSFEVFINGNRSGNICLTLPNGNSYSDVCSTISETNVISDGEWHHLAVVNNAGYVVVYLDGNQVSPKQQFTTSSLSFPSSVGQVTFGQAPPLTGYIVSTRNTFIGMLDDFKIWTYAKTQDDIQSGMFDRLVGDETGLLAYYPFDELESVTYNLLKGAGNNPVGSYFFANQQVSPLRIVSTRPAFSNIGVSFADFVGSFGDDLTNGQFDADSVFSDVTLIYKSDPQLIGFPIPRYRIPNLFLQMHVAITESDPLLKMALRSEEVQSVGASTVADLSSLEFNITGTEATWFPISTSENGTSTYDLNMGSD